MKVIPIADGGTVPYEITFKYKSAIVKILPASSGTGLKAGASLRSVMELAGYTNILSKIMGTNNKLNNALATIMALSTFKVDRSKLGTINLAEVMENRRKDQEAADAERAAKNDRKPRRNPAD
jgi:ribosomal protein S5